MFYIAAHRGGNSKQGIVESIEKKFDFVELDAHLTLDNRIVVQYDSRLNVNGKYERIESIVYNDLSQSDKESLFLLEDVFEIAKGKIGVIVDIKHGTQFYPGIGKYVAKMIEKYNLCDETWIISFDHVCLAEAKQCVNSVRIAPMYVARIFQEMEYWKSINADGVEICNEYLDRKSVLEAHDLGLTMIGWCTQDRSELENLINMELDIITIDKDDSFMNYLLTLRKKS